MMGDADLQVWLDTQPSAGQAVVIPYVKSVKDLQLKYRVELVQQGAAGTSRITQQGKVAAPAAQPTALARVTFSMQKEGECRIELVLHAGDKELGTYRFECPR